MIMKRRDLCKKEKVLKLITNVLLLSHDKFITSTNEQYANSILTKKKEYIRLNIDLVKLTISIIEKNLKHFRLNLNKIVVDLNKIDMPNKVKLEFIISFLNTLEKHSKQESCGNIDVYTKRLKIVASTFLGNDKDSYSIVFESVNSNSTKGTETQEDVGEFIDFEDLNDLNDAEKEEQANNIKLLSKKSINKVDAKSWIEEYSIDKEEIDNITEILDDFYSMADAEKSLSENYLTLSLKVLDSFVKFFNQTIEFMELSSVINNMIYLINSAYHEIEPDKKELLKMFIEGIIDDLNKWVNEVLIKQTAVDIHYLDASIYSSMAQIEMLFDAKEETQDKDEEELELF